MRPGIATAPKEKVLRPSFSAERTGAVTEP